jgi:AraC-like DNA-binding protein
VRATEPVDGVELFAARMDHFAYRPHRHDTYAISLTEAGVQAFAYRGASHASTPGQVVVLHPDELHDGHAGSAAGFRYRQVYVAPAAIFAAVSALSGRPAALPFVPRPVTTNAVLASAVRAAFRQDRDPLATDALILRLAEGLLRDAPGGVGGRGSRRLDLAAIERARQLLDAETTRVVSSWELEVATGLTRYELARQFRAVVGTTPYRYSLMRRLGRARALIARQRPLVEVALETGFADQAHLTRRFTAAFGITPGQYGELTGRRGEKGASAWRDEPS